MSFFKTSSCPTTTLGVPGHWQQVGPLSSCFVSPCNPFPRFNKSHHRAGLPNHRRQVGTAPYGSPASFLCPSARLALEPAPPQTGSQWTSVRQVAVASSKRTISTGEGGFPKAASPPTLKTHQPETCGCRRGGAGHGGAAGPHLPRRRPRARSDRGRAALPLCSRGVVGVRRRWGPGSGILDLVVP